MATSLEHDDQADGPDARPDSQEAFISYVEQKYAKEDAAQLDAEDGVEDESEDEVEQEEDGERADDDSTEEDPEAGTSADDPDGDAAESEEGSSDDDETDHPAGDEPEESEEGGEADGEGDATEEDDEDEEPEDPASDATKAMLAARGADLSKLENIPAEFQEPLRVKLKSIDAAFTRAQQELTAYRADRAKFNAEEKFRTENPELAIVDAIERITAKDPDAFDRINERLAKLGDDDQKKAFQIVVKDTREAATKALTEEYEKAERDWLHAKGRGEHVFTTTKALAEKLGLPMARADKAVALVLLGKPEKERDLTDAEIDTIVRGEAKEYDAEVREQKRIASRDAIKTRTTTRKTTPASSGRRPGSTASPRAAAPKAPTVDHNDQESRQAAILRTTRRLAPGMRD